MLFKTYELPGLSISRTSESKVVISAFVMVCVILSNSLDSEVYYEATAYLQVAIYQ